MAKKQYGIADAMRGEIRTPAPATAAELNVEQTEMDIPAASTEEQTEMGTPIAEGKRGRGRPRKTAEGAEERSSFARVTLEPSVKKKLQMVCTQKGLSETDYLYSIVKKAIVKDFNNIFAALMSDEEN